MPFAILLVHPSLTVRMDLALGFEGAGYELQHATTLEEAQRRIVGGPPDLAILGPQDDDRELAEWIAKLERTPAAPRPCLLLLCERPEPLCRAVLLGTDDVFTEAYDRAAVVERARALLSRRPAHAETVLAVDDSLTHREELSAALREEGFDVATAASGEEALELLARRPVDCILLDVLMPGMGGEETCRRIKASPRWRDIPLILLTALEDRGALVTGLSAGADDYVAKAADLEVILSRLRAQLRRRRLELERRLLGERLLRAELEATQARAARELAEARSELLRDVERKNRELEAFTYSVSHDLRAPLRHMEGFAVALLEDHAASLDEKGQDYLRRIRKAAQQGGLLIDALLELSHVGQAALVRERVDLTALARAVAEELARSEPGRQVAFQLQEGLEADADPRLTRVILENLLGNAWKFTRRTAEARIALGVEPHDAGTCFFVRDNGAGFDPAYATHLFGPFQRLHSAAEYPGSGVGLATVQRIVERHGGRIWAEARPGQGATFYWTIPSRTVASNVALKNGGSI